MTVWGTMRRFNKASVPQERSHEARHWRAPAPSVRQTAADEDEQLLLLDHFNPWLYVAHGTIVSGPP